MVQMKRMQVRGAEWRIQGHVVGGGGAEAPSEAPGFTTSALPIYPRSVSQVVF